MEEGRGGEKGEERGRKEGGKKKETDEKKGRKVRKIKRRARSRQAADKHNTANLPSKARQFKARTTWLGCFPPFFPSPASPAPLSPPPPTNPLTCPLSASFQFSPPCFPYHML